MGLKEDKPFLTTGRMFSFFGAGLYILLFYLFETQAINKGFFGEITLVISIFFPVVGYLFNRSEKKREQNKRQR